MAPTGDERLRSLDAFRGLTVAAMVLVNNPGSWRAIYAPLRHADWHGWTPTDVIFPAFVFILGVAIPLAFGRRVARGESRARIAGHVVRRAALIFALGLLLHAVPLFDLANLRIPGVLQRLAVCYLAAGLLFLVAGARVHIAATMALLLGYWALMTLVPVPGFGAGELGKEGNLAAYLDRLVLGPHIWQAARVYDPEGLLSTLPAIATALIGVLSGSWLLSAPTPRAAALGWLVAGIAGIALGEAWGVVFPINKSLWTSSYVLLTAGLSLVLLALCHWLIECRGYRRWAAPFVLLGVNALAVFFLSSLLARLLYTIRIEKSGQLVTLHSIVYERVFAPWGATVNMSLAFAVVYVALWWSVTWVLDRRNIHLRV